MSRFQRWLGVTVPVAVIALGGIAIGQEAVPATPEAKKPAATEKGKDIVQTCAEQANLKTFCELLRTAGLESTLKGTGPYTVFAPTDEAFNKVGKATLDEWRKPENKEKLRDILNNHIVSGNKYMASDVMKMKSCRTLGGECTISVKEGKTMFGSATVLKTDLSASNGVIHTIDTVITDDKQGGPKP